MNSEDKEDNEIMNQLINQITLECLINKDQYEKYLTKNMDKVKISNKKDKKFYRKRILQLTRDILLNNPPNNINNDIVFTFETYVKTCIQYFKMIDKTDIIQGDHPTSDQPLDKAQPELDNLNSNTEEIDQNMLYRPEPQKTLDQFVKKIMIKPEKPKILPLVKEINLKEPSLREKGIDKSIRKKKNVNINYEENQKSKEEEYQKQDNTKK